MSDRRKLINRREEDKDYPHLTFQETTKGGVPKSVMDYAADYNEKKNREWELERKESESHRTHHRRVDTIVYDQDRIIIKQRLEIQKLTNNKIKNDQGEVIERLEGLLESQISDVKELANDKAMLMRRIDRLKRQVEQLDHNFNRAHGALEEIERVLNTDGKL